MAEHDVSFAGNTASPATGVQPCDRIPAGKSATGHHLTAGANWKNGKLLPKVPRRTAKSRGFCAKSNEREGKPEKPEFPCEHRAGFRQQSEYGKQITKARKGENAKGKRSLPWSLSEFSCPSASLSCFRPFAFS